MGRVFFEQRHDDLLQDPGEGIGLGDGYGFGAWFGHGKEMWEMEKGKRDGICVGWTFWPWKVGGMKMK
jgi:hypothetical protein